MITNINTGFSQTPQATSSCFLKGSMLITEQDYLRHLTISKRLSKKSIKTYLTRYRFFKEWLEKNNLQLSKNSVEVFLYQKKESGSFNSTINTYIQALNHIIDCYKFNNYKTDITEKIKGLPKKKPQIIPLSTEEIKRLLNTHLSYKNRNGVSCEDLDFKYLTLTEFITITACRYDEAASLTIKQLDLDNKRAFLTDTKNGENRFIFFNGPIIEHLKLLIENKKPDDFVFTNSKGGKMHSSDFGNDLKKRAKKAGITKHVNPHLLRHSYATSYYNHTHDIAMVATILGHKDIQTTYDTYVHLDTEGIQRATDRSPLISQYIPTQEALQNIKLAIENLRIGDDKRFQFSIVIKNGELRVKVNIIGR